MSHNVTEDELFRGSEVSGAQHGLLGGCVVGDDLVQLSSSSDAG